MRVVLVRNDDTVSGLFLQSRFWAEFKADGGWSYARFDATFEQGHAEARFALCVLERQLGAGFRFAYIPHGPAVSIAPEHRGEFLAALANSLRPVLDKRCVFIRFDPDWYQASFPRPSFTAPLRKGSDVQPPDSVVIDLSRDDDALLSGMKPKWRYNIRLAEKKGVTVASEGPASLEVFYRLYLETAARDRIAIHPESYYRRLLSRESTPGREPVPDIRLWVARREGVALAAIITVFYGQEATYLYGASSDEQRNLMPAYALQWAAIRAARDAGCTSYDLYGIPPADEPDHPMSGLYRFKTGFGGQIRHYAGAWDFALRPIEYAAFRAAERSRLFWHKVIKKKLKPSRPR